MTSKNKVLSHAVRTAVASAAVMSQAVFAGTVFLNTEGTGIDGASDLANGAMTSNSFVIQTADPTTGTFSFEEYAAHRLTLAGNSEDFGSHQVTALIKIFGIGSSLSNIFAPITVTGGSITLYEDPVFDFASMSDDPNVIFGANNGTHIASFSVSGGSFALQTGGWFSGSISADSVAGSIQSGYFFSSGQDLAPHGSIHANIDMVAQLTLPPPPAVLHELAGEYAHYTGGDNVTGLALSDVGRLSITATVPEPASASLLLAGLGVLGAVACRNRTKVIERPAS